MTQRNISVTQIATIAKQISLLVEPGQVVELRVMGVDGRNNRTDSGYFDNVDDLAAAAAEYSGRAASVYMTLNPVQPALLARAYNRVEQYSKTTTNDKDIVTRRWFMIDFDPIRPSDISSTDEEHSAAIARAGECALWLADRGWPQPILADSGNGAGDAGKEAGMVMGVKREFGDGAETVGPCLQRKRSLPLIGLAHDAGMARN